METKSRFSTRKQKLSMNSNNFMRILWSIAGRIMALKDIHILILGSCEYVVVHGKKHLADGLN